ncbi:MAG: dihydroorotate dehydrogenase electron transfer subunit [Lachnospiraceae bacterium]
MNREKVQAMILSHDNIADGIMKMVLSAPKAAADAKAGQFISVYCHDGSRLLPRPISLCEIDREAGTLTIVYRIAGGGTKEIATYKPGSFVAILGPLGNGFYQKEKKAILIGGGIGIPPMLQLAKELTCEKEIVLGYRDELFLKEEFEVYGHVSVASEDGKHGVKGNVMDAIREYGITGDVIYACGPTPMLKAIKEYALANQIECQISLEERMACGIGACLGCVCQSKEVDHHTHVHNKRICKDGPVFYAEEVELA